MIQRAETISQDPPPSEFRDYDQTMDAWADARSASLNSPKRSTRAYFWEGVQQGLLYALNPDAGRPKHPVDPPGV